MASPFSGLFTGKQASQTPAGRSSPFQGIFKPPAAAPKPPVEPLSTAQPASTTPYFQGKGYGASNITDVYSGKPLLTFENQAAKSSQLLKNRVATTFDPTIPQKIDASVLHNGRMPESASQAVREATGAEPDEQLDHLISLELGGSNDVSNLNPEKTKNGVQPSVSLENKTARDVASGKISYIEGQKIIARAKGVKLPDDTQFDSSSHPLASSYPKPAANQVTTQNQPSTIQGVVSKILQTVSKAAGNIAEHNLPVQLAADIQAKGIMGGIKQFAERQGANLYQIYAGDQVRVVTNADGKKSVHIPEWITNATIAAEIGGPEAAGEKALGREAIEAKSALPESEAKGTVPQERLSQTIPERSVSEDIPKETPALPEEEARTKTPTPLQSAAKEPQQGRLFDETSDIVRTLPPDELPVKSKANIIDYLRTPEKVLQKIGLGSSAAKVRSAFEAYKGELGKQIEYLRGLASKAPGEASSKNIFRYLDGQQANLSPEELKVANEIKTYLGDWADRLDLPKDNRISHYITHIFERGFVTKEFDPEVAKIISEKVPGSVYDPFLEKRLGKQGYVEDVWRALDAYVKRAVRKVNMDPALRSLSTAADELDLESYKYVKRYVDNVNLRPTEIDNLIDNAIKSSPIGYKLGQRPTMAITQKVRNLFYRGTLGLNVGSAVKNLMQGANTYAELGERYTVQGYFDLLRKGSQELKDNGVLGADIIQDKHYGVIKSLAQKLDTTLFSLFEVAETINRGSAYYGAKAKALAGGLSEDAAVDYAKELVRKTQFAFGSIDTPVALQSDIVKTLAQLQTYSLKQGEYLLGKIKNKEWTGLVRWSASSLALVYSVGKLFGMTWQDLIPTLRLGGSPAVNAVTGIANSLSSNPQTKAEGVSSLKTTAATAFPAGGQIKKTVQGLQTVKQGGYTTPSGQVKYSVEDSPSNFIRGALFGRQGLPETQDYYNAPKSTDTFRPTFDKIQSLIKAGRKSDAQRILDSLPDSDYEAYKQLKAAASRSTTSKAQQALLPKYRKIRNLVAQGKTEEAQKMIDDLSDADYKTYQQFKAKGL